MADRHINVTLDCGCIVQIDCYDSWDYSFDGEQETKIKISDELGGGRIIKPCTTHAAIAKEK